MRKLLLILGAFSLAACGIVTPKPEGVGNTLPGVGVVCGAITDTQRFDTALRAYDVAIDAVNLLIDVKLIKPGTPTALTIADANDKVLAAFAAAENARLACNATSYLEALQKANAAIADIRAALPKRQ